MEDIKPIKDTTWTHPMSPTREIILKATEEMREAMLSFIDLDAQETEIQVKKRAAHHRLMLASDSLTAIRQSLN